MVRFAVYGRAVLLMLAATPVLAQDPTEGRTLYLHYCMTCHGTTAEGGGPMAPVLLVQPTDLTRLSAGNSGVFPVERVAARIDGSDPLVSHGSSMPIYGETFAGDDTMIKTPSGQPLITSRAIADLVAFLTELQQ